MREFLIRTATAVFLLGGAFVLIKFVPNIWFSLVLFGLISVGAFEMTKLSQPGNYSLLLMIMSGLIIAFWFTFRKPDILLCMFLIVFVNGLFFLFSIRDKDKLNTFVRDFGIHFIVIFYLYIPLYFIYELKTSDPNYLFFLIFVIAVGDSGAYFIGRAFGKHKIYPIASPKKSLEGLIAAILTAALSGWLAVIIFPVKVHLWLAIVTGSVIGLLSQLSDPIESLFKRAGNKKDSGSIFPGHGGILDRLDSYILCAPTLYFVTKYLWK
jgi:phosphatidate cytidylyltransferase